MSDETSIGFKGQSPHQIFQKYMEKMVSSTAYSGMPDTHYDDGRIQWEAPSNRTGGKFKDSHQRRRDWWARKAESIGISPRQDQWISKTAKAIHPTKNKPCKKCGRVMDIRYVYPSVSLLKKINGLDFVDPGFEGEQTEDIFALLSRLHERYEDDLIVSLPAIFPQRVSAAKSENLKDWLDWIEIELSPSEPKGILSPGVMSNAPDRFDGFHSFNLCCRKNADTGRSKENLRSYSTDRRVFEYWAAGDWIAADRLMGKIRRDFRNEKCLNGHPGPCQADHIGPISLGFDHHPHFQLLCGSCNSAKNNRMSAGDVAWLVDHESTGDQIISWHSRRAWDRCKGLVKNDENALRLSKILRDNRHSLMASLSLIAGEGHLAFLASLLELKHAEFNVEFVNLRIEDHITKWDGINRIQRETKYAVEQKARRSRIAFAELMTYFHKANRNAFVVENTESRVHLDAVLRLLGKLKSSTEEYDTAIRDAIASSPAFADGMFRDIQNRFDNFDFEIFEEVKVALCDHMNEIGEQLAGMWDDDRFIRETA